MDGGNQGSLLLTLLASKSAPKFSGDESDWETFALDWANYYDILRQAEGGEIADVFAFEVLRGCLDPASQVQLKALRQKEPTATFERVWRCLERTHSHDLVGARRREWERVCLKGGELTIATWRNYQSSFEWTLSRAEGISERESEDKILKDLPLDWRERLTKDCARKSQDSWWVRVLQPIPFEVEMLQEVLASASGAKGITVEERHKEVLVKCRTEAAQEKVLELNGWECPGGTLRIQWATRRPTVAEMCRWVERELRTEEELRPMGMKPRRVNAVSEGSGDDAPPAPERSRGKSRGGRGKGRDQNRERAASPGPKGAQSGDYRKGNSPRREASRQTSGTEASTSSAPAARGASPKGGARERSPGTCYACAKEGRASQHPFRECRYWQESRARRRKGGQPPRAAESSPKPEPRKDPPRSSGSPSAPAANA